MDLLLENISHDDLKKYLKEFYAYAKKELNLDKCPRLILKRDKENANNFFGKTGYYDPAKLEICLYISDRHPKDIIRSFAHELVHHMQNLQGKNDNIDMSDTHIPDYASKNPELRELEREAFELGNLKFRDWCDMNKVKGKNIMNEMKKEKVIHAHKKAEELMSKGTPEKVAYAVAMNLEKGKKSHGKGKKMTKKENIKKLAAEEAAAHMKHLRGGGPKKEEQSDFEEKGANPMNEGNDLPYQELFDEKERLLKTAFNKREDIIYQELIRRFIKK